MKMNAQYQRVVPRDLFNEAKLLKCIGQLCLSIHDGFAPVPIKWTEEPCGFEIGLMDEGSLLITNFHFSIKNKFLVFKTTYNSKRNFPLYVEDGDNGDVEIFDEKGVFTHEFEEFCKSIK